MVVGDRVRCIQDRPYADVPLGSVGTVSEVSQFFIMVEWDHLNVGVDHLTQGVPIRGRSHLPKDLEKLP
jgi:hypothetical protein